MYSINGPSRDLRIIKSAVLWHMTFRKMCRDIKLGRNSFIKGLKMRKCLTQPGDPKTSKFCRPNKKAEIKMSCSLN